MPGSLKQRPAAFLVAGLAGLIGSIDPALAACPSFAAYARAPMADVDGNKWLEEAIKPVVKIDRRLTPGDMEAAFNCVLQRNLPMIREVFGKSDITVDSHLYQFPASEYAYGRVLVNRLSYKDFTREKAIAPLTIMKINFDFDAEGNVVDQDLFAIKIGNDGPVYSEYKSGKFIATTRCFKCHDLSRKAGLFFKSRYNGLRIVGKTRNIDPPRSD